MLPSYLFTKIYDLGEVPIPEAVFSIISVSFDEFNKFYLRSLPRECFSGQYSIYHFQHQIREDLSI